MAFVLLFTHLIVLMFFDDNLFLVHIRYPSQDADGASAACHVPAGKHTAFALIYFLLS